MRIIAVPGVHCVDKKRAACNILSVNLPRTISRHEHTLSRKDISPEALKVLYTLTECRFLGYLAGGGVRDLLLGRKPKDFDVVTDATPNQLRKVFRNCRLIGRRFRLAHIHFRNQIIEVATFRSDSVPDTDGAVHATEAAPHHHAGHQTHPEPHTSTVKSRDGMILRDNVFGTPEQDARRRDFTINALFYNIDGYEIIDYVGGLEDLKHRLIRSIGDPMVRYAEDPVRMVRAVRFAALLDFHIEHATSDAIVRSHALIAKASNARLYEEVLKVFLSGAAEKAYVLLERTGLFATMFPPLSAWVRHSDTDYKAHGIKRACAKIDGWIKSGVAVTPAMVFATLFADYHEDMAETMAQQNRMRLDRAIGLATTKHLAELFPRVLIPRRVGEQIISILVAGLRAAEEGEYGVHPSHGPRGHVPPVAHHPRQQRRR